MFDCRIWQKLQYDRMATYREHALNSVEEVMRQNSKSAKESSPDLRFLHALMQSIGTGKYNDFAASEAEYVADSASFIGFREDQLVRCGSVSMTHIISSKNFINAKTNSFLRRRKLSKKFCFARGFLTVNLCLKVKAVANTLKNPKSRLANGSWY